MEALGFVAIDRRRVNLIPSSPTLGGWIALHSPRKVRTVKIEVTEYDIAQGAPCNPYRCPVALAIGRALSPAHLVSAGASVVRISLLDLEIAVFALPKEASEFVYRFDTTSGRIGPRRWRVHNIGEDRPQEPETGRIRTA